MRQYDRKTGLEQVYTLPSVAKYCNDIFSDYVCQEDTIIEPAGGRGAFLPYVDKAYDIDPKHPQIEKIDFLELKPEKGCSYITNPPFGRGLWLASKFFNHMAAHEANHIGFLISRAFRKWSVQDRLHLSYHLVKDVDLDGVLFEDGDGGGLDCCFQVWERRAVKRKKHMRLNNLEPYRVKHKANEDIKPKTTHVFCSNGFSVGRIETVDQHKRSTAVPTVYFYFDFSKRADLAELFKHLPYKKYTNNGLKHSKSISIKELEHLVKEFERIPT